MSSARIVKKVKVFRETLSSFVTTRESPAFMVKISEFKIGLASNSLVADATSLKINFSETPNEISSFFWESREKFAACSFEL